MINAHLELFRNEMGVQVIFEAFEFNPREDGGKGEVEGSIVSACSGGARGGDCVEVRYLSAWETQGDQRQKLYADTQ